MFIRSLLILDLFDIAGRKSKITRSYRTQCDPSLPFAKLSNVFNRHACKQSHAWNCARTNMFPDVQRNHACTIYVSIRSTSKPISIWDVMTVARRSCMRLTSTGYKRNRRIHDHTQLSMIHNHDHPHFSCSESMVEAILERGGNANSQTNLVLQNSTYMHWLFPWNCTRTALFCRTCFWLIRPL